jgi:O-antigen/teichoic acid export membrane protein
VSERLERGSLTSGRHRTGWTLVDQGLSSLTNFALGVLVARAVSPTDYGAFAVGFGAFAVALGVARSVATDPLVVRFSDAPPDELAPMGRRALGATLAVGVGAGVLLSVAGVFAGDPLRPTLWAFAVGLPVLCLQDGVRYLLFAARRPRAASANDGAWLLVVAGAWLVLRASGAPTTVAPYVLVWVLGAAVAAGAGLAQTGVVPGSSGLSSWWRQHRDLSVRFLAEFLVLFGGSQALALLVAAVGGLGAAGALRGANVLLGPTMVVATGAVTAAVPEGVRLRRRSPHVLVPLIGGAAGLLALVIIAWGVAVSRLPEGWGTALLGQTWGPSQAVVVPLGVALGGTAAWSVLSAGLRVLEAPGRSVRVATPSMIVLIVAAVIGASRDGARGAAVWMIPAAWVGVVAFGWQLQIAARRWRETPVSETG